MSHKLRDLQALSDDELVRLHDKSAEHTSVGVNYYLDEIRRREMAAAMKSSQRLSMAATFLGAVGTIAAVVSLFAR